MASLRVFPLLVLLAACGNDPHGDLPDANPPGGEVTAQVPPTSGAAMEAWLAAGHYLSWRCEAAPHAARPPGAHGMNRICSNDALAAAPAGPFPAGAASVKELIRDGEIAGHAVALKLVDGPAGGGGWYWYEKVEGNLYADGAGIGLCTGCHEGADASFAPTARDYVFTVVP
jgi:hypothetical protein